MAKQGSRLIFTAWELLVIETLLTRNRENWDRGSMDALIKKIENARPKREPHTLRSADQE